MRLLAKSLLACLRSPKAMCPTGRPPLHFKRFASPWQLLLHRGCLVARKLSARLGLQQLHVADPDNHELDPGFVLSHRFGNAIRLREHPCRRFDLGARCSFHHWSHHTRHDLGGLGHDPRKVSV